MYTLTFTDASGRNESVPLLDEEAGLTVGRDPTCDVVLQSKEVSRRHARFFVRKGALHVEDLGSHNGVYLAGERLEGPTPLDASAPLELELGDVRVSVGAVSRAPRAKQLPPRPPEAAPEPLTETLEARKARAAPAAAPGEKRGGPAAKTAAPAKPSAAAKAAPERAPAPSRERPTVPATVPARRSSSDRMNRASTEELAVDAVERARLAAAVAAPEKEGVGAGAVLRGKGKSGAVQIALPARAVVGRGADCDVVLDDDSVSRRHAELSRDDRGLYVVQDLESANGTFIDGVRASGQQRIPEGATLRFGDVELLFWRPPAAKAPARRKPLFIALLVLVALFAVAYALKERRRARQQAETAEGDDATALVEQAQAALESDRYDDAARLAQAAIDADPLDGNARKLLAQARREQGSAKLFDGAAAKAQVGREDEALRLYAAIDPRSRFFPRARIAAKDLAQGLLRKHVSACRAEYGRERWANAADACGLALDIKCQSAQVDDDPLFKLLRTSERSAGRKVPWACPRELAPLFSDSVAGSDAPADAQKALAARYSDPGLRDAIALYARGEALQALRALSAPAVARGKSAALVQEAVEKIRLVDGRFREGQTALLRNELARLDEIWGEALKADAALLPPGVDSFLGNQMRSTLAQAHGKVGDERFGRGQYSSAFDEWQKGLAVSPRDAHLNDQVARLEKVAEGILAGGPSCDEAATAVHITRAEPPSPAHQAAQRALLRCR